MNKLFNSLFVLMLLSAININANLILCRNNYVQKSPQETITKLMSACAEGDLSKVKDALYRWPGNNAKDAHGRTAFYYAVMNRQHEIVKFLLRCPDIDINLTDIDGISPLVIAIENDDIASAALLLSDKRINKETRDKRLKFTPLLRALHNTNPNDEIIKLLANSGANVTAGVRKDNKFISAIDIAEDNEIDENILKLMAEKKIAIDKRTDLFISSLINKIDSNKESIIRTSWFERVILKKSEYLKDLFFEGININYSNDAGESPLHIAVRSNDEILVKMIIDAGADVNKRTNLGESVLNYSCQRPTIYREKLKKFENQCFEFIRQVFFLFRHEAKIEKMLVESGASEELGYKHLYVKSPLEIAAYNNNKIAFETLLKVAADKDLEISVYDDCFRDKAIHKLYIDYKYRKDKGDCVIQ